MVRRGPPTKREQFESNGTRYTVGSFGFHCLYFYTISKLVFAPLAFCWSAQAFKSHAVATLAVPQETAASTAANLITAVLWPPDALEATQSHSPGCIWGSVQRVSLEYFPSYGLFDAFCWEGLRAFGAELENPSRRSKQVRKGPSSPSLCVCAMGKSYFLVN